MRAVDELSFKSVRDVFVGRADALNAFQARRADRSRQNGVYYVGSGGVGKTWILKKIFLDAQNEATFLVPDIIDLCVTQHQSIRSLCAAIKRRLPVSDAFRRYDESLTELDASRSKGTMVHPGAVANLEERVIRQFLEGCQQAIEGREVALLFDGFERVQGQYVGHWLLREFLPQIRGLIVALAGRPGSAVPAMPSNVLLYPLQGWELGEARAHILRRSPEASTQLVESVWEHTGGIPLLIDLILNLPAPQMFNAYLARLDDLPEGTLVQESAELQRLLVAPAVPPSRAERLLWAMALLPRRFDQAMLRYLLEQRWSGFRAWDYDGVVKDLAQVPLIKEFPATPTHWLHDEVRCLLAEYVADESLERADYRALIELIVEQYYPQACRHAEPALRAQLRAEQLGYILDRDPLAGLAQYEAYRAESESGHDYDLEELLWIEMRAHLQGFEDRGYRICLRRGEWLRRRSLFPRADEHYEQMISSFPDHRVMIEQEIGAMALRQGDFQRARGTLEASLRDVPAEDHAIVAMVEDNLGRMEERAGRWEQAFEHYVRSFRAAADAGDQERMASVRINRARLYSLRGFYEDAERECNLAIDVLESLPQTSENARRAAYAWMTLGTVHRHRESFEVAGANYHQSLTLAEEGADQETICHCMQQLGINLHLWGRRFRREKHKMATACQYQREAWRYLTQALDMARRTDWREAIAHGLNRLAKVYREADRLQTMGPEYITLPDVAEAFRELQREIRNYEVPFEGGHEGQFLLPGSFAQFDWLRKAARLFELSALVAMDANHYRRALDSLTEYATLLLEMRRYDLVPQVVDMIKHMKGYDYQEGLFGAVCDIIQGDSSCEQGEYAAALEAYKTGYTRLAKQTGYSAYILKDRLWNLAWRFRAQLPHELIPHWCEVLEEEWLAQRVLTARPDLLAMLEDLRLGAAGLPATPRR
jgi:tetratricopeptide (TPR) repeat protein